MEKTSTNGTVFRALNKVSKVMLSIAEKIEKLPEKIPEYVTVILYTIGHFFMTCVHEPFFDEALAWLIAKESTVYEIMFVTPHYEGHPGLWHLILMPFARSGFSYEISLAIVSYIFSGIAVYIFVFRSPFRRIIRLIAPFSYFIFYQYGVISRPYCMMMLAFVLISVWYRKRNEKSGRYVIGLILLCASSAYGIVIAGGLAIVWLIEIYFNNLNLNAFIKDIFTSKKIILFAILLAYAVFTIIRIIPRENTAAYTVIEQSDANGISIRLLYTMFGMISDLVLTNVFYDQGPLRTANLMLPELIMACIVGIAILFVIFLLGFKKHKLLLFFVPYVMFSVFSAMVYLYRYHIGITLLYIMFWTWQCFDDNSETNKVNIKNERVVSVFTFPEFFRDIGTVMMGFFVVVSLYWSIGTCICDIMTPYSTGRDEYEFLVKNNLTECNILGEWENVAVGTSAQYDINDVTCSAYITCLNPYIEYNDILKNKVDNFKYYFLHKVPTKEENTVAIDYIYKSGIPDVLLGQPVLTDIYPANEISYSDFVLVKTGKYGAIWKGLIGSNNSYIYVRKEIAEQCGIQEISR